MWGGPSDNDTSSDCTSHNSREVDRHGDTSKGVWVIEKRIKRVKDT